MSVPSHGYNCIKIASHPTKCAYCSASVVYFECSCGSKVFFENYGGEHQCTPIVNSQSIRLDRVRDMMVTEKNKQEKLKLVRKLSKKENEFPETEAYNHSITYNFILLSNFPHQRDYTPEKRLERWFDYLCSLEQVNLCPSCRKPIETRLIDKGKNVLDSTHASRYGDIESHFELVDEEEKPVLNLNFKGKLRFKYVKAYRVYDQKCGCSKEKRW